MKENKTKLAFIVVLGLFFASASQAQILEGLLYGAISSGANSLIGKNQETTKSAVKVVFDIYLQNQYGRLEYLISWDPSTQTSVWFSDAVVLKVKPFYGNGPAHDLQFFVNDQLVERRKVEGGFYSRGKIRGAEGVVDDYPFIRVADLDMGLNQVKVRKSKSEWGTAQFIRLNIERFMAMAENESARMAIAGAGHSTYPVLQSYVAKMPNGQIRNFASVEQMQLELSQAQYSPTVQESGNAGLAGQGFEIQRSAPEIDAVPVQGIDHQVRVYRYNDEDRQRGSAKEVLTHLAMQAGLQKPLPFDTDTISIPSNGDGIAILIFSHEKIQVDFRGDAGQQAYKVAENQTPDGQTVYSCLVTLTLKRGEKPTGILLIQGESSKTIFEFKETR